MNFQGLQSIEKPEFYIKTALDRGDNAASLVRTSKTKETRLNKSKSIELRRVSAVKDSLNKALMKILLSYPSIDDLPEFYQQLIRTTLEYESLKKGLGSVNWATKKIKDFYDIYSLKIKRSRELKDINMHRKEYIGRIKSVVTQIRKQLAYLEEARRVMKKYPSIKTKLFTVAIAGFPNVGKTTLLSKLTPSRPEINSYAFTTKGIMIGYMETPYQKLQLLDTPGTLNRFNRMNPIEQQAYLAIRYCANAIVYVFDLTETYPMKEQKQLYRNLLEHDKPIVCYLSKTDIVDKKIIDEFVQKSRKAEMEVYVSAEKLKEKLTQISKKF